MTYTPPSSPLPCDSSIKQRINPTDTHAGHLLSVSLLTALLGFLWRAQCSQKRKAALKGQVVIITGASSGIGAALAHALAAHGCSLVLASRRQNKLEDLKKELEQSYQTQILTVRTDVTQKEDIKRLIELSHSHFGQIDILINNAGIAAYGPIQNESLESMKQLMEVNYWGLVQCCQEILPHFQSRKTGAIINIASTAAHISVPGMVNYSASKHAVRAFSDGLRLEVARDKIKVITICPTSTQTEIIQNAHNSQAINLDPQNFPGMSPQRVARETIQALCLGKPEHLLGLGEKIAVKIRYICPPVVNWVLKIGTRFLFKK